MINYMDYETGIGVIRLAENNGKICHLDLAEDETKDWNNQETAVLKKALAELQEYLEGRRTEFDVPLEPEGTEFQKQVWAELRRVPYGTTASYGEIASRIGRPKASRAVGGAAGRNRILIFIPCHRIIGSDGSLTGFGGGLPLKKRLLELEGVPCEDMRTEVETNSEK